MSGTAETVAVVADLHLSAGDGDPFTADDRFAATVGGLVEAAAGRRFRLVLLGDTVDFPAVPLPGSRVSPATRPADAVAKLDRVLAAHPVVTGALRGVLAAGHRVDVVAGNHDMEFRLPAVQRRLRAALGGDEHTVPVHPWQLHVPGLLYAEHGQQQHDVNRFPDLVGGCSCARGRLAVPAGSYLDAIVHLRDRQPGAPPAVLAGQALRMGAGLVAGLARLSRAELRRSRRERALTAAPDGALPPAVVRDLDRAAAASPTSIARRALGLAAGRVRPSATPGVPYMQSAAAAVHRVLDAHGCAVPFYAFGHTHVAEDVPLPGAGGARYLNPGTWSSMLRRVPGGDRRHGVLVVTRQPGTGPRAELRLPA